MTTNNQPKKDPKLEAELALFLRTFRLEDKKIIRISTRAEPKLSLSGSGYLYVWAGSKTNGSGRMYLWHRIVYAVHHHELHELLDHRDGNPLNNDIGNLRPATKSQNAANARYPNRAMSKTGERGVYQLPNGKYRWAVEIDGTTYRRQPFDTPQQAKDSREAFKKALTGEHYHRSKKVRAKPQVNIVVIDPKITVNRATTRKSGTAHTPKPLYRK